MKTGARLKSFLKERGFKQTAVARGIGMKPKAFNMILNGYADLKADTLVEVFRFTETRPEAFFNHEAEKVQTEMENALA